jgi:hypothetical protein
MTDIPTVRPVSKMSHERDRSARIAIICLSLFAVVFLLLLSRVGVNARFVGDHLWSVDEPRDTSPSWDVLKHPAPELVSLPPEIFQRTHIAQEEIEDLEEAATAYDVVRLLRPSWLEVKEDTSVRVGYLNVGGFEALHLIRTVVIQDMRLLARRSEPYWVIEVNFRESD